MMGDSLMGRAFRGEISRRVGRTRFARGVRRRRRQVLAGAARGAPGLQVVHPLVGAALLALTVVKLFLFDLSHVTGIERIVSFIGIGVLLLLIGYFSPLPPKAPAQQDDQP